VSRSRHALTIQPGPRRRRSASAFSPDASTHPGSNEGGPQHGQPNTTLHVARLTSPATGRGGLRDHGGRRDKSRLPQPFAPVASGRTHL